MKLLSSSFSSSSSTISSTTWFDSKSATASYLAGILRRILCSGTLPTHPSDHVTEEANNSTVKCSRYFEANEKKAPSDLGHETNPCLVARLMGLDSMPETNFRTSSTTPTFFELHEKEFFVLSFEKVTERREFRPKGMRSEMGFGESNQRRRVKGKREENMEGHKKSPSQQHFVDDVVNSYGVKVKPSLKKKKKEMANSQVVKSLETELSSEDSSPVSVLDCGQFLVDPKVPVSGTTSSSRRKLSLETEGNLERPRQQRDNNSIDENVKSETKQGKYVETRTKESESQESSNALDENCGLREAEIKWVQKWTFDDQDFQGIGRELEALILGNLLEELVDQFD